MGKLGGFKEFDRINEPNIKVKERIKNYNEYTIPLSTKEIKSQGSRCMDCGVPFCHSACPLGNLIPDFNDFVYKGEWQKAAEILHTTNNFPEFTGRLCPAPCEQACVLGLIENPVSIENIEKNIVEIAFKNKWIIPQPPLKRTGKTIAVIGSGPSGLAAAQQLNKAGHMVTVFEREDKLGGLLQYGIPNFKLEKSIIDRRIKILTEEGIIFKTNINVGVNYDIKNLNCFDAIVLCGGATKTRSLPIPGITSKGVIQAMDYLTLQTKQLHNNTTDAKIPSAKNKRVIVIGGGDTGSDCIGTANRQGATSITNFEIMAKPPLIRHKSTPWPFWPLQLKTTSSHEEGCDRNWLINTKEFISNSKGELVALKTVEVAWKTNSENRPFLVELPNTEKIWPCDMAFLALGFTGPEATLSDQLGIQRSNRTNYLATNYQTNIPHIFTAGDMRRGQSLIVWAISEGREAAKKVDEYLMGISYLPSKGTHDLPSVQ